MAYKLLFIFMMTVIFLSVVSAGIGISTDSNSALLKEGGKVCLKNFKAYNPFSSDTFVTISVSDDLKNILTDQEAETKLVPAGTSSQNAIPIEFCFKVPDDVYEKERAPVPLVGNVVYKRDCTGQEMKTYTGEVILQSVPGAAGTGYAGSSTVMSVSSPLNVRVQCNDQPWRLTPVYIFMAVLSAGVVGFVLFRRYRKPKSQRLKEQMAKLRKEMKKK